MYNGLNNNIFMNYGGCQMGGYQYGMGIADLFSGVNGLNSVWNNYYDFGSCAHLGYGYGCGNSNAALGWSVGSAVVNVLGFLGLSWAASARANKAEEKAAAKDAADKHEQSIENAYKISNLYESKHITLDQLLSMDADEAKAIVNGLEIDKDYTKEKLAGAKQDRTSAMGAIENAEKDIKDAKANVKNIENTELKDATTAYNEAYKNYSKAKSTDENYETIKTAYENAKKAKEDIEERIKNLKKEYEAKGGTLYDALEEAKANKQDAEDRIKEIENAQRKFNDAKRILIDEIEANGKVKEVQAQKDANASEKNFQDLADDADGCDWTINKKVKNYNNRYGEADENGIRELNEGQTASIDDLRAIAHLAMTAKSGDRIKYKKQFDKVMQALGGIDKLPDDLRRFYNQGLSQVK